jgi:hypothetical protein
LPSMADAFSVQLGCPACGGKLIAELGPTNPESKPVPWLSPHCFRLHTSDFGGKLISVTAIGEKPKDAQMLDAQATLILNEMLRQGDKKPN